MHIMQVSTAIQIVLHICCVFVRAYLSEEVPSFLQTNTDIVVANGQTTYLHCAVANYNPDKHRVNWTALHQDQSYLDAKAASSWNPASKTLNLSITFQNPGSRDEGLYFCELYYLTDVEDILLDFTSVGAHAVIARKVSGVLEIGAAGERHLSSSWRGDCRHQL